MLLNIDPKTPKGMVQLEAIGWAQDQINEILAQYFLGTFKIQKGLKVQFRLGLDLVLNEKVKVDVMTLPPQTKEEFEKAVEQARENWEMDQPKKEIKVEEAKK